MISIFDSDPKLSRQIYASNKFDIHYSSKFIIGGIFSFPFTDLLSFLPFFQEGNLIGLKYKHSGFVVFYWDRKKQKLTVVKDPVGYIPLCYKLENNSIYLSPDINEITSFCDQPCPIDPLWVHDYTIGLLSKINNLEYTFYKDIKRLPPGFLLKYSKGQLKISEFMSYELKPALSYKKEEHYIEGLRFWLEKSVLKWVDDFDKFGLELSGGLDSATVAGIVQKTIKNTSKKLYTYSHAKDRDTRFPDIQDEREKIKETIKLIGLSSENHSYITRHGKGVKELFQHTFELGNGLPVQTFAVLSRDIYQLAQKNEVKLLFSGWGGDQCASHRRLRKKGITKFPIVQKTFSKYNHIKYRKRVLESKAYNVLKDIVEATFQEVRNINTIDRLETFYLSKSKILSPKEKLLESVKHNMVVGRLEASYHASSFFGVSYAYPMLEPSLVEYVLSLPENILFHENKPRFLFKKAIECWLPTTVTTRPKASGAMYGWRKDNMINDYLQQNEYNSNFKNREQQLYILVKNAIWERSVYPNLIKKVLEE